MIKKIEKAMQHFEELEALMASGEMPNSFVDYKSLMKEYSTLSQLHEIYMEYLDTKKRISESLQLLSTEQDPEFSDLIKEDLKLSKEKLPVLESEMRLKIVPPDPLDDKNVVVEIRAGAGGEEAALFASDLFRMYGMYADKKGYKIERMSETETELGGFREIDFLVTGDKAYSHFKFESGVHRVQRVPVTESQGRIQTSTVTVAVLPEAEEVEIEINPSDITMECFRSSGAGGQHINKTDSAVRLIHKPSGLVVECDEERSQFKNRDKAMKLLRTRLLDQKQREQDNEISGKRREQVGTGDRSEKIRTYNYSQSRVTDHRIGVTLYTLEDVLNGNLEELISMLAADEAAKKLLESDHL